jgi:hypothetical protein
MGLGVGGGREVGTSGTREAAHVCKCKNDTSLNYSRNQGGGMNSSMICLIHCKNLCKYKYHNVLFCTIMNHKLLKGT